MGNKISLSEFIFRRRGVAIAVCVLVNPWPTWAQVVPIFSVPGPSAILPDKVQGQFGDYGAPPWGKYSVGYMFADADQVPHSIALCAHAIKFSYKPDPDVGTYLYGYRYCDGPTTSIDDIINETLLKYATDISNDRATELAAITSEANRQATATNTALMSQAADIAGQATNISTLNSKISDLQNQDTATNTMLTAQAADITALKKQIADLLNANTHLAARIAKLMPIPTPTAKH